MRAYDATDAKHWEGERDKGRQPGYRPAGLESVSPRGLGALVMGLPLSFSHSESHPATPPPTDENLSPLKALP
jgi:hypothetical protein